MRARLHLPVPRLVLRPRRHEHRRPAAADVRRAQPAARRHRPRAGAVRDVGRLRVDQPRRRRAAAARVHRAVRHDPRRVEGRVAADRVVVRVPAPRELEARDEAFVEQYHVVRDAPAARHPRRGSARRDGDAVRPAAFVDAELQYLRTMSDGMAGMVHAERRAHRRGPARHRAARRPGAGDRRRGTARSTTRSCSWHRAAGADIPDLNELDAQGLNEPMVFTASRTTSCCRCTAARRRTASARSGRRRR